MLTLVGVLTKNKHIKALYNTHKQKFRTTMKMLSNTFHCPKMYQLICHMIILANFYSTNFYF